MSFLVLFLVYFCGALSAAEKLSGASGFASVRKQAGEIQDEMVQWRRHLHRHPELMYQEHKTSMFIQETLRSMGVSFTTGWSNNTNQGLIPGPGGTGVVAEIGTGQPIVALRADIDALPIHEETPVSFHSESDGRMHACGHDGHTSMLLGAAKLLNQIADDLPGTVRLIFQPAEEGGAGAKRMREEGVLKGVSRIFGMHLWPQLASGSIGGRAGVTLAAGDFFEFRIVGKGAHGAMPHLGVDPITAAAAVVQSLQTLTSRETDPLDAAVVSITMLHAGDAYNVIPEVATVGGTIRALSDSSLVFLRRRLIEVAEAVAAAHKCTVDNIKMMPEHFPPTVNDPALWRWLESSEAGVKNGSDSPPMHWDMNPTMGSEDFSFYTEDIPGAFIFLGQGSGNGEHNLEGLEEGRPTAENVVHFPTNTSLHSPRFNMDESVLHLGAALHTHLALRSLRTLSSSAHAEL